MKTLYFAAIVVLSACTGAPAVVEPLCTKDGLEADFLLSGPMTGSAVDARGALQPPAEGTKYLISTTYLRLPKGEVAARRFRELLGPINKALPTQDGLVGLQFASSEKCGVARTLSVWRDQAAMYKFVTGDAHADAVANIYDVTRGGSLVTHWQGTEKDATWDAARAHLAADDGPEY